MSLRAQHSDPGTCARLALAVVRAAAMDDNLGGQVWRAATPDEQEGAILMLSWVALDLTETAGMPREALFGILGQLAAEADRIKGDGS